MQIASRFHNLNQSGDILSRKLNDQGFNRSAFVTACDHDVDLLIRDLSVESVVQFVEIYHVPMKCKKFP